MHAYLSEAVTVLLYTSYGDRINNLARVSKGNHARIRLDMKCAWMPYAIFNPLREESSEESYVNT